MDDRELLELAAKAVGLPECGWMGPAFMYVKDNTLTEWSPLTDYGDALWLAVKLHMTVRCYMGNTCAQISVRGQPNAYIDETNLDDPGAATCRAIVRAAAEIGKEMK